MTVRRLLATLWSFVVLEVLLYGCLLRWVARRPDVPAGAQPLGYARLVGPMLWLWIFGSATEVVVVELVLRQWDSPVSHAIRLPLLVLGVWGVVWMLGLAASYRVKPHLLTDDTLVVRSGARTVVRVPLGAIRSVATAEHDLPGLLRDLHVADDLLLVGVSSRTNLELRLTEPTTLDTREGAATVARVGLWVDEPGEVAALLRAQAPAV